MGNRKYSEAILPIIKSQAKSVGQISAKLGKTKLTINTDITDGRNRGHDIKRTRHKGVSVYQYVAKSQSTPAAPILNTYKDHDHIDNRVKGKTKFIAKCLTDKLGFRISEQQAILYGLHLADQCLNSEEFDD